MPTPVTEGTGWWDRLYDPAAGDTATTDTQPAPAPAEESPAERIRKWWWTGRDQDDDTDQDEDEEDEEDEGEETDEDHEKKAAGDKDQAAGDDGEDEGGAESEDGSRGEKKAGPGAKKTKGKKGKTGKTGPVVLVRARWLLYSGPAAGVGWWCGLGPAVHGLLADCGADASVGAALIVGTGLCAVTAMAVDRRTRGWWPPLAWVCHIPYATCVLALLLYAPGTGLS
ncbi:hypothetical protein E0L36_13870 [Streptomyces sp. AJS327]|uniref:hypothetical protein n=1 Tax=Streptomyces sp. AJS327 TaxID=2545265 RepID=UPI0015E02284|nr:hypothetical protein [Streptomyces sp. AJS327]MBA0051943.1 hypothetical protein [Streptomyces sp. AJS327]